MLTSRRIYNEVNYLILAINAALTPAENKIPNISNLVKKKTDYGTKIIETRRKLLIMIMINILLLQNLIS